MYNEHVPIIAQAMRTEVTAFRRGAMFAAISARLPFERAVDASATLYSEGPSAGKRAGLWGWKWDTYRYLESNAVPLQQELIHAGADTELALHRVMRVPGLGLVKGAFVLQMMGHDIACIDTRNQAREGWAGELLKLRKREPAAMTRKVSKYIDLFGGRARELWNDWCLEVARDTGRSPDAVSQDHLTAVLPGINVGSRAYDIRRANALAVPYWSRARPLLSKVPF